jgi:ATP-binding cassette subfamily C protein CydCD
MNIHRRLLHLTRNARLGLSITILSGLLAGLLTIGQAYLVSKTIDGVFLHKQALAQVAGWMQLILAIIATRGLFTWLNEAASNSVAVRIKNDLRRELLSHILALGPAYSRGQRTGDLTTAATEGIEALDAYYSQYLPQLLISTLVPVSILLIIFPLDPLSGLVLLFTAPLIPFFMYMIGKGAEAVTGRQYETLSRLSAHFLDSLQGLTTLKLFGQSQAQVRNIAAVSDQFRKTTLRVLQITFLSALALELLSTLSTAIIAVEVGLRLLYARMEFQQALFIIVLAPEFYLPLRMLGLRFHASMSGTSAARRIYEILDSPLPYSEPVLAQIQAVENPNVPFTTLRLSDLSHIYPNESLPALDHINLEIRAGEHIALVGRSGAGKTTLANLLLRFFDPQEGEILLNDQPLKNIPVAEWRRQIAWVPQDPWLWHDSLAANLRLGKPDATDQELAEAARLAHLDEFIESLPQKFETHIGEAGARLSSGQAQRLALARAFLKNAPLLLLDEPTSNLDPETETLLEESTRRLMQGRTVITIAHRLNTVFKANRIIVLEAGQIIEAGDHRELLEQNGTYSRMVATYLEGAGGRLAENDGARFEADAKPVAADLIPGSKVASNKPRRVFFRLLGFLKGSWGWVALSALLSTLTISASIALMGTSAWLISTAALHPSIAALGVSVVGVRFFGISRGVFRYLERLVSHNVTFRLLARLRVWFYEKIEPLAPARLMDYRSGDLLARIIGDVGTLENFYIRVISPPITAVIISGATVFFLASYNISLAIAILGLFLLIGVFLPLLSQAFTQHAGGDLIWKRAELNTRIVDGIQGAADLLAFNQDLRAVEEITQTSRTHGKLQVQMGLLSGLFSGLNTILINLALWIVLWLCIPLVSSGRLEAVMLAPLALLTVASFEAVTPLSLAAQMWNLVREAAIRLFDVVDAEPAVKDLPVPWPISEACKDGGKWDLEFVDLSFTYPGQALPALRRVSFHLEPGASVAVVGPSGAGKSSLANLLLRFWEFSNGDIQLDGRSLHDYAQEELRAYIGFISSSTHFFNTSVRENLRVARRGVTWEEIEEATSKAHIHEAILHMPKAYDTLIGEHGQRLSGGERQRLAIARALIKNAPILILDEPTANLDALTEQQIMRTLLEAMRGRTTLLITHRLVGLENLDQILVMDQGLIVERGTQPALLTRNGLYLRMWELQNRVLVGDRPGKA